MLPLANFIADQVSGPTVPPEGRRRTDVRPVARDSRDAAPDAEVARAYLASLPRWRRISLALRVSSQ